MEQALAQDTFTLKGTSLKLTQIGYGALELAGPRASGPPKDPDGRSRCFEKVVSAGITHIDTSEYDGSLTRVAIYIMFKSKGRTDK